MSVAAFLDEAVVEVKGGRGGDGAVSFLRTRRQPRGGPDGGNGGDGGDVFARADAALNSLADYAARRSCAAQSGAGGRGKRQHGASGAALWLDLPLGTDIIDEDTGSLHASLDTPGQQVLLAKGGRGGRGNCTYKSATNRTPRQATKGQAGDVRQFRLSLSLFADVGLLGLPNAGKSSFLNAVSNAVSPSAAYPYTTLRPRLGVADLPDFSQLVFADIPGISCRADGEGKVANRYLRHASRAKVLLHMADCSSADEVAICANLARVNQVLAANHASLADKPQVLALTKTDLVKEADIVRLAEHFAQESGYQKVYPISSLVRLGLDELIAGLQRLLPASGA